MSVVYPTPDSGELPPATAPRQSLVGWAGDHIGSALFLMLIFAVVLGYLLNKLRSGKNTGTASATDTSGSTSANGTVYVPTTNEFLNYSSVSGSYNDTTTNTINAPGLPTTPPLHGVPLPPISHPPVSSKPIGGSPKPPRPTPKPTGWTHTYTIVHGDTLSAIAERYHTTWEILYSKNKQIIDALSAQHGNPIGGGPWNDIFPGETIHVP